MARIRSIKPEFWTSLTIARLSPHARLTFIGLWNYCDDHGRGIDDARLIKATVWPLDDHATIKKVAGWVDEIAALGLVQRYEDGATPCLAVTSWTEHQRVDHPKDSAYSPPSSREFRDSVARDSRELREEPRASHARAEVEQGAGSREQGAEVEHVSRAAPRDEVFEALADACDVDWHHLTPSARGALNAATKALREAGDATPDEIHRRAQAYRLTYPAAAFTPSALAKHWPSLANGQRRTGPTTTADRLLVRSRQMRREEESRGAIAGD